MCVADISLEGTHTVYPKKYAHGFVVLYFVVVMQSFIMNSHEVFIHIHQGCFAGTGAIVRLPQCQWSKPDGYGKISQCITTTKHSKAKTVCIFLGIYCMYILGGFLSQNHKDGTSSRTRSVQISLIRRVFTWLTFLFWPISLMYIDIHWNNNWITSFVPLFIVQTFIWTWKRKIHMSYFDLNHYVGT